MSPMPISGDRLDSPFYARSTEIVARELIGKALLHQVGGIWIGGMIVETEAYLHRRDPASHSARGMTPRNASMFAEPGTLYVYSIHAKYCLNAVTQRSGEGAAVLIRAIEPIWGVEAMQRHRGQQDQRKLTRGPAMLCQALQVFRDDDGRSLIEDPQMGIFEIPGRAKHRVASGKRIGISKAAHRNLRFADPESRFLSRRI